MSNPPLIGGSKPLDGILLKLARAEKHLLELDTEVGIYLDSEPYDLRRYPDPKRPNLFALAVRVNREPPPELSPIIGDCLQNMRAAIEYIALELVIAHGLTPSTDPPRTQFPIYTSRLTQPMGFQPTPLRYAGAPAYLAGWAPGGRIAQSPSTSRQGTLGPLHTKPGG